MEQLTTMSKISPHCSVPQSQGDPKIVKRGPNLSKMVPKGDLDDEKGDPKFKVFRIVHKVLIF